MTAKLKDIPNKTIGITCANCNHVVVHKVANLLLVIDEDTTTHEVRVRATCPKCQATGHNTYTVA